MTRKLRILPRAERDAQYIFDYIAQRSPQGARHWWAAFQEAVRGLTRGIESYAFAPENELTDFELRQFLFKTRRGRMYRGVFTVVRDEILVLRVRGPGQSPLEPDEIER